MLSFLNFYYFLPYWVFTDACGLSLLVVSGGYSLVLTYRLSCSPAGRIFLTRDWTCDPCSAGEFLTTESPGKSLMLSIQRIHISYFGFPGGSDSKESACKCRRPRFDCWVWKIPWRRECLLTPVFFPGEFHGQRSLAG